MTGPAEQLAATGPLQPHPPSPATVAVVHEVPHLDRLFDYAVPVAMDEAAQPGVRVRVRLAGRLVDGVILARGTESPFAGELKPLSRVLGTERVLTPEVARLCRAVADRWAGTFTDVLRFAVPPRHARAESVKGKPLPEPPGPPDTALWSRYTHGPAFLAHLSDHLNDHLNAAAGPRATWAALPDSDWPAELAAAAQASLSSDRGVVIVVPDGRDVGRVADALSVAIGRERFVELTADLGPEERYRRFLRLSRGQVKAVVGTRAAAYAPVADLGLVAVWDDGSDVHDEPHSPYANVRDVLILRAHLAGAGALIGGFAPSVEAVTLADTGWTQLVTAPRAVLRAAMPRVEVAGSQSQLARDPQARAARLPDLAFQAIRTALEAGRPALISVPRRGYRPAVSCDVCRRTARCPVPRNHSVCGGPLAQESSADTLTCRWCGAVHEHLACPECGAHRWRAVVVGNVRTADELGRSFAGVPVVRSSGGAVVAGVPARPALVVATPGAEPVAEDGYGAVLLLDAWALLGRADLRAGEAALRHWMDAAALAVPADKGGRVVLVGASPELSPVQALVRWDPVGLARREAASRSELGFPPISRMAALDGAAEDIDAFLAVAELPADVELLGPVPLAGEGERMLVRVPRAEGAALAQALQIATRLRSVKKKPVVRVRLDPPDIG